MSTVTNENKSPSVLKAAWIIAVVTIVSKLIGFVRDIIIANYYGAAMVSDAYYYAYQIPSLSLILLGGVGGPFHSATVAIFSKLIPNLQEKPSEYVNKLYSTFMTATIIFFLALSAIMFIFPRQIMGISRYDKSCGNAFENYDSTTCNRWNCRYLLWNIDYLSSIYVAKFISNYYEFGDYWCCNCGSK